MTFGTYDILIAIDNDIRGIYSAIEDLEKAPFRNRKAIASLLRVIKNLQLLNRVISKYATIDTELQSQYDNKE
jgi:hypothetical protein